MQQQLGKTIGKYRNKKGYTIHKFADNLGVSVGLVSNIETGKSDSFQLTLLNNIVKELNIPLDELQLFSIPFSLKNLDIINSKDFKVTNTYIEKLIETFIYTSSTLAFNENKINLLTNILLYELDSISKLVKTAKSKY